MKIFSVISKRWKKISDMCGVSMLPNPFMQKREAKLLVFVLMFAAFMSYVTAITFDELFMLMALAAAFMAFFKERPMKFGVFQYLIFALTGVMLISAMINGGFATGKEYYYDFSSVMFMPEGQDPNWIIANFSKIKHVPGIYGWGYTFSQVTMWWIIACLTARKFTKYEIRTVVNFYVLFAGLVAVVMALTNWNLTTWATIDRNAVPFWFVKLNANLVPYFVIPMSVICFARIMVKFDSKNLVCWRNLVFAVSGFLSVLICGSRGATIGAVVSMAALFVYLPFVARNYKRMLVKLGIILGSLLLVLVIAYVAAPEAVKAVLRIGGDSGSDSTGSGRTDIWKEGLSYLVNGKDILFGKGWGYHYFLHQGDNVALFGGMHNFFMQYLVSSGLIAVLLAAAVWVAFFLRTLDLFGIALMGGTILSLVVEQGIFVTTFLIPVLIYISVRDSEQKGGRHCLLYYFLDEESQSCYPEWAAPKSKNKFFERFRPKGVA